MATSPKASGVMLVLACRSRIATLLSPANAAVSAMGGTNDGWQRSWSQGRAGAAGHVLGGGGGLASLNEHPAAAASAAAQSRVARWEVRAIREVPAYIIPQT